MGGRVTIAAIQRAVAEHYQVETALLKGPSRCRHAVYPRQVSMALARRLTDHSTVRIGSLLNRDHSTVVTGARRAENRCLTDDATRIAMRQVTRLLLQPPSVPL